MYDILADVYAVSSEIESLKTKLESLEERKKDLIINIIESGITESGDYTVSIGIKLPNKSVDVDKLKTHYPSKYEVIKNNKLLAVKAKHEDELNNIDSKFSQAEVKQVLNKAEVESVLVRVGTPTKTYNVHKKGVFEHADKLFDEKQLVKQ